MAYRRYARVIVWGVFGFLGWPLSSAAQIAFVQVQASAPQTPQSTVTVAMGAQTAGNTNVVVVGWNDSTTAVTSITDTKGNAYTLAIGPTVLAGQASQSIYFAPNIAAAAAGANTVTVRFSAAAFFPDVRVAEYRGLDPVSPLHAVTASTGTSATTSSGALTVSVPSALLVASNTVGTSITGAGTGFTNRIITQDGDIVEDRIVAAAGSYSATAPLSTSGYWVMQMAAFKPPQAGPNTPPTISNIPAQVTNEDTASSTIGFTVGDAESPAASLTLSGSSSVTTLLPNANIVFGGSGANRTVTLTPAANQFGTSTVTLTVSDGQATTSTSFVLTVNSVNDPPTITAIGNQSTTPGTPVGPINFTVGDVDTPVASLTLSGSSSNPTLLPNGNIAFGGSGASRTVTLNPAAGQSGTASVTVTVSDGVLSTSTGFQLTVGAPNTPPTISTIADQTTASGNAVGPISFTVGDAETPAGSLTLSGSSSNQTLLPTANIVFGGSGANRTVTLTPAAGQSGTASVTVTVSDGTLTASATFVLTVTGGGGGTPLPIAFVQVQASAPQTPQSTVTVGLAAQTAGNTNIVIVGWNDSTATVTSVTDTKGNAYTLAIGPTILAGQASQSIYFAPNIASAASGANTVTVRFSAAADFADVRVLEYSGLDQFNPLHAVAGSTGNSGTSSSGTLTVSVPSALLVSSNTVGTSTAGAGAGFTNRMITPDGDIVEDRQVSVAGGYSATAPLNAAGYWVMQMAAFKAQLTGTNTPPTISNIPAQVTNEDTPSSTIGFTVGDAETPAGSLTLSATSSVTTLLPNANIVFGGSGANRSVTLTPSANQFGTTTVTITVSDGQATASTSFTLTVSSVNDPPTITAIANQTTGPSTPVGPINFTVGDVDTPVASLTLSGGSSNQALLPDANIVFGGSGANRTVTLTPAAGQSGTASVTITVSDGLLSTSTGFQLTVTANSAPTISPISNQATTTGTTVGPIGFTVGDAETPAGSLTVSGSSSNTTLLPNANIAFGGSGANRTVTLTPAAGQTGTATVTVTVSDGSLSASTGFLLTVGAANTPPTISNVTDQTTTSGTAAGPIGFTVGDAETPAGSLTLSGSSSNTALLPNANIAFGGSGANRTVTLTPAAGQTGTATVTMTVSDGALSASDSFVLTVNSGGGGGTPLPIAFVQVQASAPQTPQSTVTVPLGAQAGGNTNIVIVGWNDSTATVTSVTDTKGNAYTLAIGPTVLAGQASQSIYFAPNIAAAASGANTVTVRFSAAADFADVRVLEYSGLDPLSPLHAVTAATGTSGTSSSGALSVSAPSVLLVAGNTVGTSTAGAGAGFTNRTITPDGDIVEDRQVTVAGSYSATAPLNAAGYWVMQMAAFKAQLIGPNTPPTISNIPAQVTNEDTPSSTIGFTVGDAETPAGSLTLSATSSVTTLLPNANIAFGGSGANRTVTMTPALNQFGTTTVTITASDGQATASTSFVLTVNSVNDPPTITAIGNQSTAIGTAVGPIAFTVGDVDTPVASLTLSGSSSNPTLLPIANIVFGGSGASRTVTLTPAAGQSGTAAVTVTVSDGVLNTSTGFQLTVGAANTAPTISAISNQATTTGTTVGPINFTVGDAETPAGSLTLSATSSNTTLLPNANIVFGGSGANRTVTLTPAAGQTGAATVTVTVSDGTLTASSSFTLSVSGGTPATISFIQSAYSVPQTPQSTVTVGLAAQTAGNANIVIVGWNDSTATVTSITDTKGNAYTLAIGPTILAGQASQSIYFAPNIVSAAAGANTVTVRFSAAANFPDVRVLEYSGLDPTGPLHAVTAATGVITTSSSGTLTTTVPNVLLVAANTVGSSTAGPGPGFTSRVITVPDGDIAEDQVASTPGSYTATAPLTSSAYWVMQMAAFKGAGLPGDTTPPTVAITAPLDGASVTSTITVAASATDNVSVVGVQFFLDGTALGPEVLDPPFSILWDTSASALGNHILTATARDGSGNSATSLPVTVTIHAAAPSDVGQWLPPATWPLVTVHATLLSTGDVLAWDGPAQSGAAFIWRPSTNTFTSRNPPDNIFCAGHTPLPDGRVLVVGGHIQNFVGIPDANIFNPTTSSWTQVMSMVFGRWYPTAIMLPDRRVLVVAGDDGCDTCRAATPEIYDSSLNSWTQLNNATNPLPEYPHLFVLQDGRVLQTGSFEQAIPTQVLDIGAQTWTTVDPVVVDGHSSVMYGPTKFMKSGTSATSDPPYVSAATTTYVLDMSQPNPAWRSTAPMAFPRSYHNLTVLPDGSVLATGGGRTTDPFDQTQSVFPAELWSPVTETWTTLASLSVPRLYHSIALLLPDARVLVSGGGRFGGGTPDDQLTAEIFSPPYLFKGTRPVIGSAPATLSYNTGFSVATADAGRIATVSMIPVGSVTHHFNANQRYLSLPFTASAGSLSIQAPANANVAPPGYYMLFIVDTAGIPSVAAILRIQ